MNGEPYKIDEVMQYTETVYYDANGEEVERVRNFDDCWYDSGPQKPLEDWERADYFGEDN